MDEKTQKKSLPPHLTPGNPGNSGGKPGRSGRKPNDFIEWCKKVVEDETTQMVFAARAKAGDLPTYKFAAEYAHGKPKEHTSVQGEIRIVHVYDEGDAKPNE